MLPKHLFKIKKKSALNGVPLWLRLALLPKPAEPDLDYASGGIASGLQSMWPTLMHFWLWRNDEENSISY